MANKKDIQSSNETSLLSAADCARICQISRRSWFRLNSSERCPAAIRVGGSPRWIKDEINAWIRSSCPDRETWEYMKMAAES